MNQLTSSSYQHWLISISNKIATITLNRPAVKNRIDATTLRELGQLTSEIQSNKDIWAVILKANGDSFSTGVDVSLIGAMINNDRETYESNLRTFQGYLDAFEAIEKPIVAALHGYVIGGGLILALCCDFRIAADNIIISLPEVKRSIGVIMGTQRITRTIGLAYTKELVMLGNHITSQRAYEMGLVNQVVAQDNLDEETKLFAEQFLDLPPLAVGLCKKIINEGQFLHRAGQELEIEAQAALLETNDFKEAISSFLEKRKPNYKGS
ncbi:MAG: enoyl-CoA hydratase/isomerase family protein [Bacteroidia bacterium]|nr:enoyl-CoA hydratase/isomerase family protein [Bacteroidia bacterium]